MRRTTTSPWRDRALGESYDIERICPSYGSIIDGRETVRHLLAETIEALKMLAHEPIAGRLGSFNRAVFEGAVRWGGGLGGTMRNASFQARTSCGRRIGGEGGIRTPDTVARMPHFECGAFNHSATSPSH